MPTPPPELPRISDYVQHYAAAHPERELLLHDSLRLSYAEVAERVDGCARALLASGMRHGDRVAAYGPPRPEFFITFLAAASIGAVWLGLNPKYTHDELLHNVDDAQPRILFGLAAPDEQAAVIDALERDASSIDRIVVRSASGRWPSLDEFLAEGSSVSDAELAAARDRVRASDAAAVVYTSGSTGRPKGALLPHRGLTHCSLIQAEHWFTFDPLRVVCDLPINHVGCLGDLCSATLVAGGTLYFMEKFHPSRLLDVIARERITFWGAVPTMLQLVTQAGEWPRTDLSTLRRIVWSGAGASEDLIRRLRATGAALSSSYGMTETVGSVTYTEGDDSLDVLAETIGRPDARYDVRVVRPDGSECDAGEEGEIVVRGDFIMLGYLNRPDATAETIRDGRLHTGDAAVRRPDGNITLVGRLSDMYKSGGYNVYCREVELALERHPAVDLAAVVAVPDALYGEVGHAFIVSATGAGPDPEKLRDFARQRLANYKVPKAITLVDDVPRLPIGKVDKTALRQRV